VRAKNDKDARVLQEVVRAKNDKIRKLSADLECERRRAAGAERLISSLRDELAEAEKRSKLHQSATLEVLKAQSFLAAKSVEKSAEMAAAARREAAQRGSRCARGFAESARLARQSAEMAAAAQREFESFAESHRLAEESEGMAAAARRESQDACGERQSGNALNFLAAAESFAESHRPVEKSAEMAAAARRESQDAGGERRSLSLVDSLWPRAALSIAAPLFGTSSLPTGSLRVMPASR
jgi:hypothetical protein